MKELERLQEIEEKAFYDWTHEPSIENKTAHEIAKKNLIEFAIKNGLIK